MKTGPLTLVERKDTNNFNQRQDSNVSVRGDSKPTMAEFVDRKTFRETVENLEKQIKDLGTQKSAAKAELEDTKDKIGSIKELKQEAKAFVTFHGYSKLLGTSSFFQKTLWLVCLPPLSGFCLYLVVNLYQQYLEFNVVTQLRIREEKNLTFPAVTICVQSHPSLETRDLKDVLTDCTIKVVQEENCTINDFFHYQVINPDQESGKNLSCYQFNTGRTADNHSQKIHKSTHYGIFSGLTLFFTLAKNDFVLYVVSANQVRPSFSEFAHMIQSGKRAFVSIQRTVDIKLPKPYNDCLETINSDTSEVAKEVLDLNVTYRRVNCFEWCMIKGAKSGLFFDDQFESCSQACPLECRTNGFEVSTDYLSLDKGMENILAINFFYSSNKYTELSQTVKTTEIDLISNAGGTLGLFLDFTFLSVARTICQLYEILF